MLVDGRPRLARANRVVYRVERRRLGCRRFALGVQFGDVWWCCQACQHCRQRIELTRQAQVRGTGARAGFEAAHRASSVRSPP